MASHLQDGLISQMRESDFYPHATAPQITLLQTHISFVFLTGTFAYKVKKAVKFDFLDYTSVAQRGHFCMEEVRLNRRGAPEIYLEVLPVAFDGKRFTLNGQGDPVEYVVKMRQFPQECLMSNMLAKGNVDIKLAERLGHSVARNHKNAPTSDADSHFGDLTHVAKLIEDNLAELRRAAGDCPTAAELHQIEEFSRTFVRRHAETLSARTAQGFIRECHGDLHLRNVCLWEDRLEFFDCIEFNDAFRHVDVMYDVAFVLMDFDAARRRDLRTHFLNAYLEQTGDWAGAQVLDYYLCRQAIVRGKVQSLLADELPAGSSERDRAQASARQYFELACRYTRQQHGCIVMCCGLSGSGKSTLARALAGEAGAIHIRSDAVRKHLAGIPVDRPGEENLYHEEMTQQTYSRLRELGFTLAAEGSVVILDATYSGHALRQSVIQQAQVLNIPIRILYATAPPEVLERRLAARRGDISDATAALLPAQRAKFEPLSPEEEALTTHINTAEPVDIGAIVVWVTSQR